MPDHDNTLSHGSALLMNTYGGYGVTLLSGSGSYLFDVEGKRYLDFLSGISVVSLGHGNPAVAAAVSRQASILGHVSNFFYNEPNLRLAEEIDRRLASGPGRVFFSNSGTEANEAAIKLARRRGGPDRYRIISFENGFHGRTFGSLAATAQPSKQDPFRPLPEGFGYVPYGDLDALAAVLDESVAAVMVETIQGEGGVIVPPRGFLEGVITRAHEVGAVVIVDEVQTGMCRTGEWFGFHHDNVAPDIVTLAKALGNGFPIGATWATAEVASSFIPGDHGSTFGGNALASAAALAVFSEMERIGAPQRAHEIGELLAKELGGLSGVETVRGKGLLLGVVLEAPIAKVVAREALSLGLIVNALSDDVLRVAPPITLAESELHEGVGALEAAVERSLRGM